MAWEIEPASLARGPVRRCSRVLVIDADAALFGLLRVWLEADNRAVVCGPVGDDGPVDLVIVVVAFPRLCGVDWIQRIADQYPMVPILALSSTFVSGIDCCGPVALALGVACVLPNPVSREALTGAARRLLAGRR